MKLSAFYIYFKLVKTFLNFKERYKIRFYEFKAQFKLNYIFFDKYRNKILKYTNKNKIPLHFSTFISKNY